jgi:hypothetical protein
MKPGRWWRAQNACVDNAKLIKLNDRAHRNWFNLSCVANEHGGVLPDIGTVAIKLRLSEARAAAAIAEMVTTSFSTSARTVASFLTTGINGSTRRTKRTRPTPNGRRSCGKRRQN